jgi:hypothetical protein
MKTNSPYFKVIDGIFFSNQTNKNEKSIKQNNQKHEIFEKKISI